MKIVVIGGSGLIGSKLVTRLNERGHLALPASPRSGVNTITGEGVSEVLQGAAAVVDVTNAPSWDDAAVMNFFETSTRNLLRAEEVAGVQHHIALSVVGADRMPGSGFMRAKIAQETLIRSGNIPCTIVRSTQFFEFLGAIAKSGTSGTDIRLPTARFQPIAADDVAATLADLVATRPLNGMVELAGPEPYPMDDLVRRYLSATGDSHPVIGDPKALYFGVPVNDRTLTPGENPRLGTTTFEHWLSHALIHA